MGTIRVRHYNYQPRHQTRTECGITLMEVLVAIIVLAIMAAAGISNLIIALKTAKYTEVNFAANSLAISKVEEIAAIDVGNLNSNYNEVEPAVTWPDLALTFTRTTTININGDDSRTVDVSVMSNSPAVATNVTFSTTLAVWE